VNQVEKEQQQLAREDALWDGPRLHILLLVTVIACVGVIYAISSVRDGDWSWSPLGHDPANEILPSGW
jgi:hypothetical protein